MNQTPTYEDIRSAPKVLLHDHLDGGLRPETIIELAAGIGYDRLPTEDPVELGRWFLEAASSGSLELYLEGFEHTLAVMQTPEAIERVARECAEDLAADGVVYAEVRYAPELLTAGGLTMAEAVEASLRGFEDGCRDRELMIGVLLCGMRQLDMGMAVAELVAEYRGQDVVGFDIAGPEAGFPASRLADAFRFLRAHQCRYTVHAGEAAGLDSIADTLTDAMPERLGHGVRIVDDIHVDGDHADLGPLADYVRERQLTLELCPTSNVQTGAAASIAEHPVGLLHDLAFTVTVNTDNRLMSGTTLSRELSLVAEANGWDSDDIMNVSLNAVFGAFLPLEEKAELVEAIQAYWT